MSSTPNQNTEDTQKDNKNTGPSKLAIIGYIILGIVVSIGLYFLVGKLYKLHWKSETDRLYENGRIDIDYPRVFTDHRVFPTEPRVFRLIVPKN